MIEIIAILKKLSESSEIVFAITIITLAALMCLVVIIGEC